MLTLEWQTPVEMLCLQAVGRAEQAAPGLREADERAGGEEQQTAARGAPEEKRRAGGGSAQGAWGFLCLSGCAQGFIRARTGGNCFSCLFQMGSASLGVCLMFLFSALGFE